MQRYQSGGDGFNMESRNVRDDVIDETIDNLLPGVRKCSFVSLNVCVEMWKLFVMSRLMLRANYACWSREADCGVHLRLDREEKISRATVTGGPGEFKKKKTSNRGKESVGLRGDLEAPSRHV